MNDETPRRQVVVKLRSFSRSLPMSLLLAREAVMQRFRPSLHHFNITEQQWRVLRALHTVPEIEVTALARATSLLPPSLSRILHDLEAGGLVLRRPAAGDLRKSLVALSEDGLRLIEAVAPRSEEIYGEITAAFGEDKLARLQELLRELTRVANALPPVEHPGRPLPGAVALPRARPRGRPRKTRRGEAAEPGS